MKSSSDSQIQASKKHEDTGSLSRRQNLLRRSKLLSKGADSTQKSGMLPQMQLHSFSTSDLNPSVSSRALISQQRARPLVVDTQARSAASNISLSSFSASALVPDSKEEQKSNSGVQSSTTVFKAPIRSSLSVSQATALSHFDSRRSMELRKGPHTQSSPDIHVSTTLPNPSQPPRRDIITASTDNLMIREYMLASKLKRIPWNRADSSNPTKPKSLTVPHHSLSPHSASDISGGSDDEFTTSSPGADVSGNCTTSWNAATAGKEFPYGEMQLSQGQAPPFQHPEMEEDNFKATPPRSVPMDDAKFSNVPRASLHSLQLQATMSEPKEIARRSFTLDKQHTIASASAAGLPIIGSGKVYDHRETQLVNVSHIDMDTNETPPQHNEEEPLADYSSSSRPPRIQDKTGSTSSSSSSPTVMCLVIYSDPKDDHIIMSDEKEIVASVPSSVVEQLQLVLNACKNTHSMQERNVLTKQQQVRQKVHLSYMHKVKESKTRKSSHGNTTAGSHRIQAPTRENQKNTHTTITQTNATHIIAPCDPLPHSVTRIISQPESSGGILNTRDNGVMLPQSSTAKKLPLNHHQPLRELPLSPIAHADAQEVEEESKLSSEAHMVPEKSQNNPWIEVVAGEAQQSDKVIL